MSIAALVISILALAVSFAAVFYARMQGVEALRMRRIEAARWHDEREPKIKVEAEDVNRDGGYVRLRLTLLSQVTLNRVDLKFDGPGATFHAGSDGVPALQAGERHPNHATREAKIRRDDSHVWLLNYDPVTGPAEIAVRVVALGASENGDTVTWESLHQVRMPFDLKRSIG